MEIAADHVIAQCRWQTNFDDIAQSSDLQSFLSQWSRYELIDILLRYFEQKCPVSQTWQIEKLVLDLGDIELTELETELPKRVARALAEAISSLFNRQQITFQSAKASHFQVSANHTRLQEFISWFLNYGTIPWWFTSNLSIHQIIDQQLTQWPEQLVKVVRTEGKKSSVRRRLVWQWTEPQTVKLISLLTPTHSRFIEQYVEDLLVVQRAEQVSQIQGGDYKSHIWFWVLTHLLVEQGTLFNTQMFVRSTLWQMSQHYQIDFQVLLSELADVVATLNDKGAIAPQFLQAVMLIHSQEQVNAKQRLAEVTEPDYWQLLADLLSSQKASQYAANQQIELTELFTELAYQDQQKMALLLTRKGRDKSVRDAILTHFKSKQLTLLVEVVAPSEQRFILAHVNHTERYLRTQQLPVKLIWQVLLDYLFVDSGSHFNRKQFVARTLKQLCQSQRLDYQFTLSSLIYASELQDLGQHNYTLLSVLQELNDDVYQQQRLEPKSLDNEEQARWQPLIRYLLSKDGVPENGDLASVFADCLRRMPSSQSTWLASILQQALLGQKSREVIAKQLLNLIQPSDLYLLIKMLAPDLSKISLALIESNQQWQQARLFPMLQQLDTSYLLHNSMLEVLLMIKSHKADSRCSEYRFIKLLISVLKQSLAHNTTINFELFSQQLAFNLRFQQQHPLASIISQFARHSTLHPSADIKQINLIIYQQKLTELTPEQQSKLVAQWLSSASVQPTVTLINDLLYILSVIAEGTESWQVIYQWYQQQLQHQSPALLQLISDSVSYQKLLAKFFPQFGELHQSILVLTKILEQSELWQGSVQLLQQTLFTLYSQLLVQSTLSAQQLLICLIEQSSYRLNIVLIDYVVCLESFLTVLPQSYWQQALVQLAAKYPTIKLSLNSATEHNQEPDVQLAKTSESPVQNKALWQQDFSAKYLNYPETSSILSVWLNTGSVTSQQIKNVDISSLDISLLLRDILLNDPEKFKQLTAKVGSQKQLLYRLVYAISDDLLLEAIKAHAQQKDLTFNNADYTVLLQFFQLFSRLSFPGIPNSQYRLLLKQHLLSCWLRGQWQLFRPQQLVRQYLSLLMRQYSLTIGQIKLVLEPRISGVIEALQQAITTELSEQNQTKGALALKTKTKRKESEQPIEVSNVKAENQAWPYQTQEAPLPIAVRNAGLVLMQSYFSTYLERLTVLQNNAFVSSEAQRKAVHYLEFLVTGHTETGEEHLPLNKILCGLPLHEPIELGIEMTTEEMKLGQSLIEAMINYWSAIGSSSVDGFRGNWLVREGTLTEASDHWDLIIEKRPYDVLLQRAPFSFSIIKYPWMNKPIYVTWPT